METRIFAMSPLEVGGVVDQVGDVEVRGDWREPGAEEGLWGRHCWDIVRGDGIQSPQVEQAKLLCWRREDGANQGISKKGPGDRSTAAALINLIHKVTRRWLVDAKLRGRWLGRVPRVWIYDMHGIRNRSFSFKHNRYTLYIHGTSGRSD